MDPKLKTHLAEMLHQMLHDKYTPPFGNVGALGTGPFSKVEVTRISTLVTQVKVWESNGAPRYFNVTVSEML